MGGSWGAGQNSFLLEEIELALILAQKTVVSGKFDFRLFVF